MVCETFGGNIYNFWYFCVSMHGIMKRRIRKRRMMRYHKTVSATVRRQILPIFYINAHIPLSFHLEVRRYQ